MENIEKNESQQIIERAVPQGPNTPPSASGSDLIKSILRRWKMVLTIFMVICVIGIPSVFFVIKPAYQTKAAIRVAPVISSILFSGDEGVPMYKNFMYTQADLMTGDNVLQRVVDDFTSKDISFFKAPESKIYKIKNKLLGIKNYDPVMVLREALVKGNLMITPENNTELIKIVMTNYNPAEMEQIVNSFVRAYMSIVASDQNKGPDHKLTVLENEYTVLTGKLQRQRDNIRQMAQEYGTDSLSDRQKMMLQRVAAIQAELTKYEMKEISLKVQIQLLSETKEQKIPPDQLMKMKYDFINADLMVQNLSVNIVQTEQQLIILEQNMTPNNPQLQQKIELLAEMKKRLDQRKEKVEQEFSETLQKSFVQSDESHLIKAKLELEQVLAYENHLREILKKEDADTIEMGRKQLAIQDLQDQLNLTKELYETVRRRIQELEMERKRPARVSVAYYANTTPMGDRRLKLMAAILFGALASAMATAVLKDHADSNLYTPNDVVKRVGSRVIGTTTRSDSVKKKLLPRQVAEDYRTICANLGLLGNEGIPRKLVITSPGPKEGKTTLAINLSANLAKMGKTVLLIDGDLRKPEIGKLLTLKYPENGLGDLIGGKNINDVICKTSLNGFDVLATNSFKSSAIYNIITQKKTLYIINMISQGYDHIIIDSPPVLAVPDALLWAKMADGVVLTSFAGFTGYADLKETLQKLKQINVNVLGTVLNNVPVNQGYHPYGYEYSVAMTSNKRAAKRKTDNDELLLPIPKQS